MFYLLTAAVMIAIILAVRGVYSLWWRHTVSGNARRLQSTALLERTDAADFLKAVFRHSSDSRVINAFIRLIQSDNVSFCALGIKSLIAIRPSPLTYAAVPDLTEALKHSDPAVRSLAVTALSVIARNAADEDPDFTRGIIEWLIYALANEGKRSMFTSGEVITNIVEGFAGISSLAKPLLAKALANRDIMAVASEFVVLAYGRVLFASKVPIADLICYLESENSIVRQTAVVALGFYGSRARHAIPAIERLWNKGDSEFDELCRITLRKIDEA